MRFLYFHVQWKGRTALMQASKVGHLGAVKDLVEVQAGVDEQDEVCKVVSSNLPNTKYAYKVAYTVQLPSILCVSMLTQYLSYGLTVYHLTVAVPTVRAK